MSIILAATDLSRRSDAALQRAAILAADKGAALHVLHVVDDDQPEELLLQEITAARAYLARTVPPLYAPAAIHCIPGDPFDVIPQVARQDGAEIIILGAHRRNLLRDVFIGTTAERVIRSSHVPVLMVNRPSGTAYGTVAVAMDLGPTSKAAAQAAARLGMLTGKAATALHACPSLSRLPLAIAGIAVEEAKASLARETEAMQRELEAFLRQPELAPLELHPVAIEGAPLEVLPAWVKQHQIDLLVVGTRVASGMARLLLGSTAEGLLARAECDMLVVPSGGDVTE